MLEKVAGDSYVHFNPAHQATFLAQLESQDWSLIAGRFNAADQGVRDVLGSCKLFTIVQNPIERFYASYLEARAVKTHPLHEKYSSMSAIEAAQYCIDEGLDYGRNSQCQAISGGEALDANTALEIGKARFELIVTTGQTRSLVEYLGKAGFIQGRRKPALRLRSSTLRSADRKALTATLKEAVAEDMRLFKALS
ncbi:MAG: hypothetical protein GY892_16605 [Shimia sp.]|nr:hypothetical protein [Shimia sp.]